MHKKKLLALMYLILFKKLRATCELEKVQLECQRQMKNYQRHVLRRNQYIFSIISFVYNSISINRRGSWSFHKNGDWWSQVVPLMNNATFKENFRVERSTFFALIDQVGPHIRRSDTNYRAAVPVEKRIACALFTLGSSSELRTIGHLFGIGRSTAAEIVHEFCDVLINMFFYRIIKFPKSDSEIEETISGFQKKFDYPMCVGALDGTHIAVKPPLGFETDYFNYKKYHSIIMLATVNANMLFTYINIGAPGRCNDASIFSRSTLSEIIKHQIYTNHHMIISNMKVQSHLIADSAFPLDATLMKPFIQRPNMPRNHIVFNYRLSRARCTVERAFGALKNRFRILHRKMEFDLNNTINIIKAAAILHNVCLTIGDNEEVEWNIPIIAHQKPACNIRTTIGTDVRETLVNYFSV